MLGLINQLCKQKNRKYINLTNASVKNIFEYIKYSFMNPKLFTLN